MTEKNIFPNQSQNQSINIGNNNNNNNNINLNNNNINNINNNINNNNNNNPPQNTKYYYNQTVLNPNAIPEICRSLTSAESIDDDVEKYLSEMADNFISVVLDSAYSLAKHKHSDMVEIEDLASAVNDNFGIYEPSLYTADINQMNMNSIKNNSTNDHKKRMELTKEETKNVNI